MAGGSGPLSYTPAAGIVTLAKSVNGNDLPVLPPNQSQLPASAAALKTAMTKTSAFNPRDKKYRACCYHTKPFTLTFGVIEIFIICFMLISVVPDFNTRVCSDTSLQSDTKNYNDNNIYYNLVDNKNSGGDANQQQEMMWPNQQQWFRKQQLSKTDESLVDRQKQLDKIAQQNSDEQLKQQHHFFLHQQQLAQQIKNSEQQEKEQQSTTIILPKNLWQTLHTNSTTAEKAAQTTKATMIALDSTTKQAAITTVFSATPAIISTVTGQVTALAIFTTIDNVTVSSIAPLENIGISLIHEISCALNLVWMVWAILQIISINFMFYGIKNLQYRFFMPHIVLRMMCLASCAALIGLLIVSLSVPAPLPPSLSPSSAVALIIFLGLLCFWQFYLIKVEIRCCEFVKQSAETGFSMSNTRPIGPSTVSFSEAMVDRQLTNGSIMLPISFESRKSHSKTITNTTTPAANTRITTMYDVHDNMFYSGGINAENTHMTNKSDVNRNGYSVTTSSNTVNVNEFLLTPSSVIVNSSLSALLPDGANTVCSQHHNSLFSSLYTRSDDALAKHSASAFIRGNNSSSINVAGVNSLNMRCNMTLPPLRHTFRPR